MFCPSCGIGLAQALSYCNHCGANLSAVKGHGEVVPAGKTVNSLVWAIVATTIIVLGMGLGALVLMKDGAIAEGLGSAFVVLCFLTLPVVEGVLIWQLRRLNNATKEARGIAQGKDSTASELDAAQARSLAEPVASVPSSTEQTTRAFEPSYRKSKH